MERICSEVRSHLPAAVAGSLSAWRTRAVELHLRRCDRCAAERDRQRLVSEALAELGSASAAVEPAPPEGLLERLLVVADEPGVRGRVAVPARGAVSGARPALSVALLVAGAAAGTAVGWTTWRGIRAVRGRSHRSR